MTRLGLALAIVCHLVFAGLYALHTPAFEGPGELERFTAARTFATTGELPTGTRSAPLHVAVLAALLVAMDATDTVPRASTDGVAKDGACAYRHGFDEVAPVSSEIVVLRLLRAFSILCGACTLFLTWRIGRTLCPERGGVAAAAAICVACLPQWAFTHATLDERALAGVFAHLLLLEAIAATATRDLSTARAVRLGAWLGLGMLSGLAPTFVLLPAIACGRILVRGSAARGATLRAVTTAALVTILLAGWWFAVAGEPAARAIATTPASGVGARLCELATAFVGTFGVRSVPVPGWLVMLAFALIAASLLGVAITIARSRAGGVPRAPGLLLLLVAISCAQLGVAFGGGPFEGRDLAVAAGPMLLLYALGLHGLGVPGAVLALAPLSAALVQALVFWPAFALDPARLTDGYEAALHGGLAHTGPSHPGLRLLAPEADAIVRELPLFRFTTPGDLAVGAGCTLHLVDDRGRVLFASFEELGTNLAGEVRLPVRVWNAIAPGTTVRWRVRRIPNRAHHEGWRAMPTSEWRSFVRQR